MNSTIHDLVIERETLRERLAVCEEYKALSMEAGQIDIRISNINKELQKRLGD